MKIKGFKVNTLIENLKLSTLFGLAALFFSFSSFFGVYNRTIYHMGYFVLFFILEILFYLGLKSGNLVIKKKERKKAEKVICVSRFGSYVILFLNILSILSFVYFMYLFIKSVGISNLGKFNMLAFDENGRTSLEQITLMVMQLGGEAAFLIMSCDKTKNYKKIKSLSSLILFLPGIRALMLGTRYTIAVETLLFLIVKGKDLKNNISKKFFSKIKKLVFVLLLIVLFGIFMHLFATRSVAYTAVQKYEFEIGDMKLKPVWEKLYYLTDGKIDALCTFSDYMAEAPYIFSYYCKYGIPETPFGGIMMLRPIMKSVGALIGYSNLYDDITSEMMTGKYSGCFYAIICDCGLFLAPLVTYLIGVFFSKVERSKKYNKISCAIYPILMVMCFFAPVYYFNVGRLDFTIFFTVLLSILCLKQKSMKKV